MSESDTTVRQAINEGRDFEAALKGAPSNESNAGSEMVGVSAALRAVLTAVARVAPTDTTVLIEGETGTGKEIVARAVHARSHRGQRPLIKLSCAAVCPTLIESELFGHVTGAFTGAARRREGRFQLAHRSTLLLDEVNTLSIEAQAKLLRVLQEREFEPVGSSRTLRVDVRVIAASNQDLAAEVRAGRFRADLFYRLNVFPINLSPLRERREDILPLAEHFMTRAACRLKKPLERIAPKTRAALYAHSWPGNVRELENTIERAAVLSRGPVLSVNWDFGVHQSRGLRESLENCTGGFAWSPDSMSDLPETQTLLAIERNHIVATLERTGGVIEGSAGAARALGMKPSTLRHRMRKLSIARPGNSEHRGESSETDPWPTAQSGIAPSAGTPKPVTGRNGCYRNWRSDVADPPDQRGGEQLALACDRPSSEVTRALRGWASEDEGMRGRR